MNGPRPQDTHGVWAIAAAYVGTVVGAGFASGQEILQFFTAFGRSGLLGLLVTLILFAGFGARILYLGWRMDARSHRPIVQYAVGPYLGPLLDGLLTLFLLATTATMASGAGATLWGQYQLPHGIGSSLLLAVTIATVITGIRGVVRSIGFVAPLLIGAVLLISVSVVLRGGGLAGALSWAGDARLTPIPLWYVMAPLYVSYNLLLTAPVLAPLGRVAAGRPALLWGGIVGGAALAAGAGAIHLAIAGAMPEAAAVDIPILYAAQSLPSWVPPLYSVLLLAEIYTTAVASLFGFASRVGEGGGRRFALAAILGGLGALVVGQFRFATLVGTLYPFMGAVGALLLLGLVRSHSPTTR